jgi:hypothetical protein
MQAYDVFHHLVHAYYDVTRLAPSDVFSIGGTPEKLSSAARFIFKQR